MCSKVALSSFFLKFKSSLLVKRAFSLLNDAFAMTILDLLSRAHLVVMLLNISYIPGSPAVFDLSLSVLGMVALNCALP
jgi:hypothetical protein